MIRQLTVLSFALWLLSTSHAVAQDVPQTTTVAPPAAPTPNTQQPTVTAAELDVSVPESPAFTVLGVSPQEVPRPATPRAFATALISAVGRDGDVQRGLAIDTAPYLLAFGNDLTLNEYRESRVRQVLAGTTLSVATTAEEGDDADQRVAVGLRVTLFDRGDPRLDDELNTCLTAVLRTGLPTPGLVNSTTLTKSEKLRECREKSQKRNWN